MGKGLSVRWPPATRKSNNFVRVGYVHLFYLEIDVPLMPCRQSLEWSIPLHILWNPSSDDCAQHHFINCIKSLQWLAVSCRLCVCCQLLQHSLHRLPALVQQAGRCCVRWSESMQLKRTKAFWFSHFEFYIIILHKVPVPGRKLIDNNWHQYST